MLLLRPSHHPLYDPRFIQLFFPSRQWRPAFNLQPNPIDRFIKSRIGLPTINQEHETSRRGFLRDIRLQSIAVLRDHAVGVVDNGYTTSVPTEK